MAYITYGDDGEPSRELRELHERYRDRKTGLVDNILRVHSHNPPSMRAHFELYKAVMRGRSDLSRVQREMIAVVVSQINACHY